MSDEDKKLSKERAAFADLAPETMPPPVRKVPKKPKTRDEKQVRYRRYGKAPPWRLPPELIEAVAVAARDQDVSPRDLAEFLVRGGLELLARGQISLAVADNEEKLAGKVITKYPDVPDAYRKR